MLQFLSSWQNKQSDRADKPPPHKKPRGPRGILKPADDKTLAQNLMMLLRECISQGDKDSTVVQKMKSSLGQWTREKPVQAQKTVQWNLDSKEKDSPDASAQPGKRTRFVPTRETTRKNMKLLSKAFTFRTDMMLTFLF